MPDPRGRPGNLPSELSSFVGRRHELRTAKRLLTGSRLLTLTGPGGTGKTRLAIRLGAEVNRVFPDGVWFVDLSDVRRPGQLTADDTDESTVAYHVGTVLSVREQPGSPLRILTDHLREHRALLIMDNCEQLVPACAIVIRDVLVACADVRVVATSREPLWVGGETLYQVPPLPTLDPVPIPGDAPVGMSDAVALFVERARAARHDFALTPDTHRIVSDLCHRLDGLPLAIELAATRVAVLTPAEIHQRLTPRFALLSSRHGARPLRQQTLRACVDWSFELCSPLERTLWARLAVFTGSFELDAVEGICADTALSREEVVNVLAALVERSIVLRDLDDGTARYRMLETIREYGHEILVESGEEAILRRRHRDWYRALVARARDEWVSDRQGDWLARLTVEHSNIRAAVQLSLATPGEAAAALEMLVSLPVLYWRLRGVFGEGRGWLDLGLAQTAGDSPLRARALLLAGHLAVVQGDMDAGMRLLEDGERLAVRLDAFSGQGFALLFRGIAALFRGEVTEAVDLFERGLTLESRAPDLDLHLDLLNLLSVACALAGDDQRVEQVVSEIVAITEPRREGFYRSRTLYSRGLAAWRQGRPEEAARCALESIRVKQAQRSTDWCGLALCLELLAWCAVTQAAHRRAAALLGAAERMWSEIGSGVGSLRHLSGYHDECVRQVRAALGESGSDEAIGCGRAMTLPAALAEAFQEARRGSSTDVAREPGQPALLTRREREVAVLVAEGISNREIAKRLVISQRTAETHVQHILDKLGLTSRVQVATWLAGLDLRQTISQSGA